VNLRGNAAPTPEKVGRRCKVGVPCRELDAAKENLLL